MDEKKKLELIEEIKNIERELYLKRSKLASIEAMEYGGKESERYTDKWKKSISELIELIGKRSVGGDSVKDVRKERGRSDEK